MPKIISIHSFRGGTGKSNTAANLAALMAKSGCRVGVVDTDIQSPGIHVLFGLEPDEAGKTLNDFLWGNCDIEDAAHDLTDRFGKEFSGKIFLVPSSMAAKEIARVLREGYDVGMLNDGFTELMEKLDLDVLVVDTHPGLNEETLLAIAISDILIIIMRPDQQDVQGTAVTVDVACKLNVPEMMLVVNKTPKNLDFDQVASDLERVFGCTVGVVLAHSDEMMNLAGKGVFVLNYPEHRISCDLKAFAGRLLDKAGLEP